MNSKELRKSILAHFEGDEKKCVRSKIKGADEERLSVILRAVQEVAIIRGDELVEEIFVESKSGTARVIVDRRAAGIDVCNHGLFDVAQLSDILARLKPENRRNGEP